MPRPRVARQPGSVIVALLGSPTRTNLQLAYAWRRLGVDARVLWPWEAVELLGRDDVALLRLDIVPTLARLLGMLDDGGRVIRQAGAVRERPLAPMEGQPLPLAAQFARRPARPPLVYPEPSRGAAAAKTD